jgi:hypothetical protein
MGSILAHGAQTPRAVSHRGREGAPVAATTTRTEEPAEPRAR